MPILDNAVSSRGYIASALPSKNPFFIFNMTISEKSKIKRETPGHCAVQHRKIAMTRSYDLVVAAFLGHSVVIVEKINQVEWSPRPEGHLRRHCVNLCWR
jgi:hypothetical protein